MIAVLRRLTWKAIQPIDDPGLRNVFKGRNSAEVQKCQTFRDTLNVAVKECQMPAFPSPSLFKIFEKISQPISIESREI